MSLKEWAENEVKIACKRENPDWDGKSFDYGCSCYQSALKAYKSLLEDEHSGFSFSLTRDILERLMRNQPLTPITDKDFDNSESISSEERLKDAGLKSEKQCPRMPSLFRQETLDGKVRYGDNDRIVCFFKEENYGSHFGVVSKIIDGMFPITMPYVPPKNPYKIFCEDFLVDPKNGDFDTVGILSGLKPDGERFEINKYLTERDHEFVEITKEEYDVLKQKAEERVAKEQEQQQKKEADK